MTMLSVTKNFPEPLVHHNTCSAAVKNVIFNAVCKCMSINTDFQNIQFTTPVLVVLVGLLLPLYTTTTTNPTTPTTTTILVG